MITDRTKRRSHSTYIGSTDSKKAKEIVATTEGEFGQLLRNLQTETVFSINVGAETSLGENVSQQEALGALFILLQTNTTVKYGD